MDNNKFNGNNYDENNDLNEYDKQKKELEDKINNFKLNLDLNDDDISDVQKPFKLKVDIEKEFDEEDLDVLPVMKSKSYSDSDSNLNYKKENQSENNIHNKKDSKRLAETKKTSSLSKKDKTGESMSQNKGSKKTKTNDKSEQKAVKGAKKFVKMFFVSLLSVILVGTITALIVGMVLLNYINKNIDDDVDLDLENIALSQTSFMYYIDEDGNEVEMEKLHTEENRVWAEYEEIPKQLIDAFISIEDERFWKHKGVDWKRTIGATIKYVTGDKSYGGSTIDQQLIKNLTGEKDVTPQRKIAEIFRALNLEKKYSKELILETYLNTINLSQNCFGVKSAARTYFDKNLNELTLAECASIAGITQTPTKYNPFINPENNKAKQELVLMKMLELGYITQEEHDAAVAEELKLAKEKHEEEQVSMQSYYADQVINDVIEALMEERGYTKQHASRLIYHGGLKIITAMDNEIQKILDEEFANDKNFPNISSKVEVDGKTIKQTPQAAMPVIESTTGRVVAIAGGRGEKVVRGLNRATQSKRQPGSAMKPIGVYAPALNEGITTWGSVYDDSPFIIKSKYPKNYYSGYKGLMTVKYAVAQSVNTVAVKIEDALTPEKAFDYVKNKFGVTSLVDKDIAIAPMALGGLTNGITPLELTAAYSTFANDGIYNKPYTFTKVYDSNGNVLLEHKQESKEAITPQASWIMNRLLKNVVDAGTGTAARISGIEVGGKTGTTDNDNDRWFVGITPYYTSAVWFGYDIPAEVRGAGSNPALRIWKTVNARIHENLANKSFKKPDGIVNASYCKDSGMKPGPNCSLDPRGSRVENGIYVKGTEPKEVCSVHTPVNLCTVSGRIATPFCPEETQTTIALLNVDRQYPYQLAIGDAQYMYVPYDGVEPFWASKWPIFMNKLPSGMYPGMASQESPLNIACPIHTPDYVPPEDPDNPEDPDDPDNPEDPDNPDDPNNPTEPENPTLPGLGGDTTR